MNIKFNFDTYPAVINRKNKSKCLIIDTTCSRDNKVGENNERKSQYLSCIEVGNKQAVSNEPSGMRYKK